MMINDHDDDYYKDEYDHVDDHDNDQDKDHDDHDDDYDKDEDDHDDQDHDQDKVVDDHDDAKQLFSGRLPDDSIHCLPLYRPLQVSVSSNNFL